LVVQQIVLGGAKLSSIEDVEETPFELKAKPIVGGKSCSLE